MMTRSTRSAAAAPSASWSCRPPAPRLLLAACSGSDDAAPTGTATDAASTTATQSTDTPATDAPTTDVPMDGRADDGRADDGRADHGCPDDRRGDSPRSRRYAPGAYDVGVQTITITDADRNRPLNADVWFPIDDATGLPAHQYTLLPGVYYESPTAVDADSTMVAPGGPFPLVVYSHGSGGLRYLDSNYTEAIASHGYIVAAPDHTGNTAIERLGNSEDDFDVIALNRPQDIEAVIDAMTDPAHPEAGAFAAGVDPEQIVVTGHSFGGFTAYAMASGYTLRLLGTFEADPRVDAMTRSRRRPRRMVRDGC